MIIFNNGQGGGGSNQTADLSFINNGVYNYNGYQYTGMAEIASEGLRVYASGGVLYIDTWEDTTIKIVRADGIVYYKELGVGVNTITDLPRGVYIIASKKIVL